MTLHILDLLELMFGLGMYQNESRIINIVDPLIGVLDGTADMTVRTEELEASSFAESTTNHRELRYQRIESTALIHDAKAQP